MGFDEELGEPRDGREPDADHSHAEDIEPLHPLFSVSPGNYVPKAAILGSEQPVTFKNKVIKGGNVEELRQLLTEAPEASVYGSLEPLLLLAAELHNLDIINLLLDHGAQVKAVDEKGNNVLHKATANPCDFDTQERLQEILQKFLDADVEVNSKNEQDESPLFLVASFQPPNIVEFLLSKRVRADPTVVTKKGETVLHGASIKGCASSLTHLLKTGRISHLITKLDQDGKAPFYYAVGSNSFECCEVLLNHGDHLTTMLLDDDSRCSYLLKNLPSATELLERQFNARIAVTRNHEDCSISFDYTGILPPEEGENLSNNRKIQSSLIDDLNNTGSENLLKHPLIETFLGLKWNKIRFLFYTKLSLFLIFLLIHTIYVVRVYTKGSKIKEDFFSYLMFSSSHMFMYLLIVFLEVIITLGNLKMYLKHMETLTKAIALISSAYVVFSNASYVKIKSNVIANLTSEYTKENETRESLSMDRQIAAVSVFFGWTELMMMFGRLPSLGSNILMFAHIAKSTIKFIVTFAALLIGFSTSFMVLFYNNELFKKFWKSLMKTLTMTIGEVDYNDLVDTHTDYISYIMLVAFIFLVCILMANFLVGLAVDNLSKLEQLGKIERLSKQASYIVAFEKLTFYAQRCHVFPRRMTTTLTKSLKVDNNKNFHETSTKKFLCHEYYITKNVAREACDIASANKTTDAGVNVNSEELTRASLKTSKEIRKMKQLLQELSNVLQSRSSN
ncbi:Transient receptor potential channel pyrexia-like 3 [Homarus americanus]|uniref:Transient receptor potential channel pyrexia-like 3 n=1 Tax=Homarus americanus TaxID=6706 RepID=A0A8J5MJA9_HOMAM|nr:Transient receptor potential channel pyrexia-like 3 [Homarus americanus]